MEFTTEQAKSIFDLIKSVSPYAYPLLISLLLPIVWVTLKKLLGVSFAANENKTLPDKLPAKIMYWIKAALTLKGDIAEKIVFCACIALFIFGGVVLKIGEQREEVIRQNALELKEYFITQMYTWENVSALDERKISDKMRQEILHAFPEEFIQIDNMIYCTDSVVIKRIDSLMLPLFEAYVNYRFRTTKQINIDSIKSNFETNFSRAVIYKFLRLPANRGKYEIGVENGRAVLMRREGIN
jgi:hypothetical protein